MIKTSLKLMLGFALLAGLTACPSNETATDNPSATTEGSTTTTDGAATTTTTTTEDGKMTTTTEASASPSPAH